MFDFDFIARDKAPNPTPELPKNPNAELSQNPKTSTEEKHSFNPPAKAEGDTGGLFEAPSQAQNQTPNKTTLQKDLSTQEIKEAVQKWDLDNPNPNDKLLVSLVQGDELEKLSKEFDFKGNYAIAREIDSRSIKHALIQHGDEAKESARGQIAITKDDIAQYQRYTQSPDLRILQDNNRIVYAKQVNGHYVVIEEVLTGQNKLHFFDMWKGKGKINEEVLLSHSQRPKHDFEPNSNRRMPSNTNQIIQKISQKFNKDEKYAKNLYEWHKDSHPFTKEADGTPKVFYHSSRDIFETFDKNFDESKWGFWFSPLKEYIDDFRAMKRVKGADKVYKVFLKAKKIADLTDDNFFDEIIKQALKTTTKDKISFYPYMTHSNEFKDFLKNQGYDGLIWNAQGKRPALVVFDSNQIKEVGNKGTFDATNPNIYHSSSTTGGGLAGGTIAGVEKDDEGNAVGFSPEKFALGFAAGASGAKALAKIANTKPAKNIDIIADKNLKQGSNMENQKLKTRLDKAKTQNEIIDLPTQSFKNIKEFNKLFDGQNGVMGIIKTPYKNIQVRIPYAYRHFYQNTNNKNRDGIKSAFFETFRNPLFITKEKRGEKDSIYFYKPFYDKDKNIINLFGIGVDSKNKVDFKTFYLDEIETRIKQVLKVSDENVLYIKK